MEQIVFPIPEVCEYITVETKQKVYYTAERDDQGSKVSDFFERHEDMFAEMKWQKKLRGEQSGAVPLTLLAQKRFQLLSPWSPDQIVEKSEYVLLVQLNWYILN